MDYRNLLLSFIVGLGLCDHMGDVADTIDTVLDKMGMKFQWNEFHEIRKILLDAGVKELYDYKED